MCTLKLITMPRDLEKYVDNYAADYSFESVMVEYRRRLLLDRLAANQPKVIVEIGCGSELQLQKWLNKGGEADCWIIVEPAEHFASIARASGLPNLHVIQDFFESAVDSVQGLLPRAPDMLVCSGLLHEVPSSSELLIAIRKVMGQQTKLHVNVPNSESLHRRLAKAMGLINDTKTMSERNQSLLQHRVYDMSSLKSELAESGLKISEEGGYLIKPFTHAQMEQVATGLGSTVLDGLFELGKEVPELASEIWVEGVLDKYA